MGLIQPGHPNSPLVEMSPVSDVVIDVPAEAPIYVEPIDAEKTVDEADLVVAVSDEESVEVTKLSNKQLARELSDIAL